MLSLSLIEKSPRQQWSKKSILWHSSLSWRKLKDTTPIKFDLFFSKKQTWLIPHPGWQWLSLCNVLSTRAWVRGVKEFNPFPFEWVLRALIDFTLSNARRFYSSMGNLLDGKGLTKELSFHNSMNIRETWPYTLTGNTNSNSFFSLICNLLEQHSFCLKKDTSISEAFLFLSGILGKSHVCNSQFSLVEISLRRIFAIVVVTLALLPTGKQRLPTA